MDKKRKVKIGKTLLFIQIVGISLKGGEGLVESTSLLIFPQC